MFSPEQLTLGFDELNYDKNDLKLSVTDPWTPSH